jgi:hypothetical protein
LYTGPGGGLYTGPGGGLYTGASDMAYHRNWPPLRVLVEYLEQHGRSQVARVLRSAFLG